MCLWTWCLVSLSLLWKKYRNKNKRKPDNFLTICRQCDPLFPKYDDRSRDRETHISLRFAFFLGFKPLFSLFEIWISPIQMNFRSLLSLALRLLRSFFTSIPTSVATCASSMDKKKRIRQIYLTIHIKRLHRETWTPWWPKNARSRLNSLSRFNRYEEQERDGLHSRLNGICVQLRLQN